MKYIILIIFILISHLSYSQKEVKIYNNKITNAEKVEVKNGVVNISRADTVIVQIFSNPSPKNQLKLYLYSFKETRDNLGLFVDTLRLIDTTTTRYENIQLAFAFDNPIEEVNGGCTGMGNNEMTDMSEDKKLWKYFCAGCNTYYGIVIIIKSKQKPKITMYGVTGYLSSIEK